MPSDRRLQNANSRWLSAGPLVIAVALSGCASLQLGKKPMPSKTASEHAADRPLTRDEAQAAAERIDAARNQAQCDQAVTLWEQNRSDEARGLLEQVLVRNPKHSQARRLLADLALEQGDANRAEQMLLNLLAEDPRDDAVKASLAWLYDSQGRDAEAQSLFQQLQPQ